MTGTIQVIEKESFNKLLEVISQLRDPMDGCPWDLEQTHESLIPFVIEEAHEVADAIREVNDNHFLEELGDLLLQIVLHAQIAAEEKRFSFNDVVKVITKKLIRRHPHVFNNKKLNSSQEVSEIWEKIKLSENNTSTSRNPVNNLLKRKIRSQPAIKGAITISKTIDKEGFKWESIDKIWDKFDEEVNEFKQALVSNNLINAEEELGDILFTLINISRWYELDPEEGLHGTNKKVLERFKYLETILNGEISNKSIKELQLIWQEAKRNITLQKNLNNNKNK